MRFGGFLRNLFRDDKRIDFLAVVFSALLIAIERKIEDISDRIGKASEKLFAREGDRTFFIERTRYYLAARERNEISLNQLARKIARLGEQRPDWVLSMNAEAIEIAKAENDGLQDRVLELIESLKGESAKAEGEDTAIVD
ncbi:MAG: hypothetical protein LBQ52_07295 [Helicobacteraceae bacterium]|nr:hypothetical protein [Helicobacteraceae bacterium]